MAPATHSYLHFTRGTQYLYGLGLNDIDADGSGNDNSAAQFGVAAGSTADEDLMNMSDVIGSTAGLPIYYLDGPDGDLHREYNSGFSVLTAGSGRLAWNEWTGTEWTLSEVGSNDYVLCHVFATNDVNEPMKAYVGQGDYGTLSQARNGANTEIANLITQIPAPESLPVATLIFQTTNSYSNAVKGRVRTNDEGDDYINWTTSDLSTGASPSSHLNLTDVNVAATGVAQGHIDNSKPVQVSELTTTERDAVVANAGMIVYNTTDSELQQYDGADWTVIGAGGASFSGLSDTPSSYTGEAGKALTVNSTETGLEYTSYKTGLPIDIGAVGDGVADDTAAIQAAVTANKEIPAGIYLIDSIIIPSGSAVQGAGAEKTFFLAKSDSINMFYHLATVSMSVDIRVEGVSLSTNSKTNVNGIYIDGNTTAIRVSKVRLNNINIEGAFIYGIYIKYCANTFASNLFISAANSGFIVDNCADTDLADIKIQNGIGYGFRILGGAGAFDEGVRLVNCSTNGQAQGLYVEDQDWGCVSNCSFSTCTDTPCAIFNSTNWKFSSCEFAPANPIECANVTSTCTDIIFDCCQFVLGTFGIVLNGERITVSNSQFKANSNIDIYFSAINSVISGNICDSNTASWSIYGFASEDYNMISGNVTNGTQNKVGVNTVIANSIIY